jgi:hypothetical protein
LAKAGAGIQFNEHMDGDGEAVFRHACKLGFEGIVSKRKEGGSLANRGTSVSESPEASQRLDNDRCACSSKNGRE